MAISEFLNHLRSMEDTNMKNLYPYLSSFVGYREILLDEHNWASIAITLTPFRYTYDLISALFDELGPGFVNICAKQGGHAVNLSVRNYIKEHFENCFDKDKWQKLSPLLKETIFHMTLNLVGQDPLSKHKLLLFRENVRLSGDSRYLKKIDKVLGLAGKRGESFLDDSANDSPQKASLRRFRELHSSINSKHHLFLACSLSALFLIVFGTLRFFDIKALDLDIKWLVVAGVPIIIALLSKGMFKSFKGFGIEVEMNLSEPVSIDMVEKVEVLPTESIDKSSLSVLQRMSDDDLNRIERLRFKTGDRTRYALYAVNEYLNQLPRIKFIEIAGSNNKLRFLLPVHFLISERSNRESKFDERKIEQLLHVLETDGDLVERFPYVISDRISDDFSIVDAYKGLLGSNQGIFGGDQILPVVNRTGVMIGICRRSSIEARIAKVAIRGMK